ncbi:MAG: hypothetical protein WAU01_15975 [Saprospiraceae bacterium]
MKIEELFLLATDISYNLHHKIEVCKICKDLSIFNVELLQTIPVFIDIYAIKHIIKKHGNQEFEKSRGQDPIKLDDFYLIAELVNDPNSIIFRGKNKLKQDCYEFSKLFNGRNELHCIFSVRVNKNGITLMLETMYKKRAFM